MMVTYHSYDLRVKGQDQIYLEFVLLLITRTTILFCDRGAL